MHKHLARALAVLLLGGTAAHAGVITIPWTLDFSFIPGDTTAVVATEPGGSQVTLPTFSTQHEISHRIDAKAEDPITGTDVASIDVRTGLRFPAQAQTSFSVKLPFEVTFTAPDHARAGQNVFIGTSIQLADSARFSANGQIDFQTQAFMQGNASLGPFNGNINIDATLPNGIFYEGSGLRLGGTGSYQATDDSATTVSAGPFARQTASGQVFTTPQQRFEGEQFQTSGRVDAQRGELNLLALLKSLPVIGSAVAAVDAVLDLDLRAGVDLTERATLSTGAMYALYSEPAGQGPQRVGMLNSLGSNGFSIGVPQSAGSSYAIDLYGLGMGFGLQRDMLMTPEMELVLDAIWPFGEWRLLGGDLGDSWLLGRQYSRFQYEEYFWPTDYAHYIPPELRQLNFLLDADAPSAPPIILPELPLAPEDFVPGSDPFRTADLPGTAPAEGGVEYVAAVPEPGTLALLVALIPALVLASRRRRRGVPTHAAA